MWYPYAWHHNVKMHYEIYFSECLFFAALWSTQPPTCPSVEILHLDSYIGSNETMCVFFTKIMCLFFLVKCSVIMNTIKIRQLHHKPISMLFGWFSFHCCFQMVWKQLVASWIPICFLLLTLQIGVWSLDTHLKSPNRKKISDG